MSISFSHAARLAAAVCLVFLSVLSGPARAADETPPSIKDFFRRAAVTSAAMSPAGRYVALTQPGPNGRQRLVVVDLQDLSKSRPLAAFEDVDIVGALWVNDRRLVFSVVDRLVPGIQQKGNGLFVVALDDGLQPRRLIKGRRRGGPSPLERTGPDRELSPAYWFFSTLRDGSDDIVVQHTKWDESGDPSSTALLRLDTTTGIARSISNGVPDHAYEWALDAKGMPRAVVTHSHGRSRLYTRPDPDGPWVARR